MLEPHRVEDSVEQRGAASESRAETKARSEGPNASENGNLDVRQRYSVAEAPRSTGRRVLEFRKRRHARRAQRLQCRTLQQWTSVFELARCDYFPKPQ